MIRSIGVTILAVLFFTGCGGDSSNKIETNSDREIKENQKIKKQPIRTDEDGKVKTIALQSGSAESITLSKNALFVAKGKDGVDIVKIGYEDAISSELVGKIDGINAKNVTLSGDENKLYVENEDGFLNVVDISNLSNPIKESVISKQKIETFTKSSDNSYEFRPKGRDGLEIYNISNPSNRYLEVLFDKSSVYDVVLADSDTKALLAAGDIGINLLDITTISQPNMIVNFQIKGGVKGLSLNRDEGLLFVANGDNGVLIYSLNVLLDKIIK